ncbi:sugar kinase [Gayadomonas joobiniege]|uniref:sugar kinase n=1 Tax=Gayadomonas joobiniege TaxID=1234606 RepID=UPI0004749CAE|nr:sugar kinase [Gayadomonas joobiniege]
MKKQIALMGECMLELSRLDADTLKQNFGGDVFNTAVYLKRIFANTETSLLTCVGQDALSEQMLQAFANEGLNNKLVSRDQKLIPGAYLINTDEAGERTFVYWRSASAARQVIRYLDEAELKQLDELDMFFFSGISLAILPHSDRYEFFHILARLKKAGVKIVFDPNYRARMWRSVDDAKNAFEQAFSVADILLPGIDDFNQLYQLNNASEIMAFCKYYEFSELIIKDGARSVTCVSGRDIREVDVTPADTVVDSTAAGDSFNGIYLGARLNGLAIEQAVQLASQVASLVVQYKGAIVPKQIFNQVSSKLTDIN